MTPQHRRQVFALQRQPRGKVMMTSVHDQFMSACVQRNEARFKELVNRVRLLGKKETINQADACGRTPLIYLCDHGSHRCVEDFARLKLVNVNLGDKDGNTPLHYAAQAGHAEVVEILLSKFEGIEVDARNKLGITPLIKACVTGKRKCVQLLLDKGADPLARDPRRGLTAAQWAYLCSWPACARVLEAHSMLSDTRTSLEYTPVPNSITLINSSPISGPESRPECGPECGPGSGTGSGSDSVQNSIQDSVQDSVQDSIQDSVQDSVQYSVQDPVQYSVQNSAPDSAPDFDSGSGSSLDPGPNPGSKSDPDSESIPSFGSRHSRLLQWYSESDLSQESSWLRARHTALTGGDGPGRRASLPARPATCRPVEPATWRTASEVPTIRVLEVEAPVDPVIVQYGDPVPPDQRAVQQNQMVTLCLPGMGKGFAYE